MTGKNHQLENDVDIWSSGGSCKLLETANSSVKPQSICPVQSTPRAHARCPTLWISHLQATTPQHTARSPLIYSHPYSQILVLQSALRNSLPAWEITMWHCQCSWFYSTHEVWDLWMVILHLNSGHSGRQISSDCHKHLIIETKRVGLF